MTTRMNIATLAAALLLSTSLASAHGPAAPSGHFSGGGFHGFPGHSFGGGFRAPGSFGRMGGNFGGARFGGNGNGIGAGIAGAILGLAAGAAGSAIYAQPPVVYAPAPVYDDQGPSTYGQPPAPSYAPLQQGDPGLLQVPAPPQLAPPQEQARGLGKEVEATS